LVKILRIVRKQGVENRKDIAEEIGRRWDCSPERILENVRQEFITILGWMSIDYLCVNV
jgi:hypothetical protein